MPKAQELERPSSGSLGGPPDEAVQRGQHYCGSWWYVRYDRWWFCNLCHERVAKLPTDREPYKPFSLEGRAPVGRQWDSKRHAYVKLH